MGRKLTQPQFVALIAERNKTKPPITPIEPYAGLFTKILFECANGHQYRTAPTNALRSNGCLQCSGKGAKTHDQFIAELDSINASRANTVHVQTGERYVDAFTKIRVYCENGHTWDATPNNLINSRQGCRVCSGKHKKTHSQFVHQLAESNPGIQPVSYTHLTLPTKRIV